jgi:hypothetical protein
MFVTHHLAGPVVEVHAQGKIDDALVFRKQTVEQGYIALLDAAFDKLALLSEF